MSISNLEIYSETIQLARRQVVTLQCLQGLLPHIDRLEKQVRTLQGVVSSLQQDVATLEEKFSLMEKVLNVEVLPHMQEPCEDDIDNATADRDDFLSDFAQGHDWEKLNREGFTL